MKFLVKFWKELKRRNVHKGIISYVIFSWVLLQVISVLGSLINTPSWLGKTVLISLFAFLPFWLFFSWFYDITPEGIKRTKPIDEDFDFERSERVGKRLNFFIITFLMIAVVLLIVDRTRLSVQKKQLSTNLSETNTNSIAVLPFKDVSTKQDQAYFADGLADELTQNLSKIIGLNVTSRTSAFAVKNKGYNISEIAKALNVNYILEGSIRTQDSLIKVSVQLIDTKNDKLKWSETWNKPLKNVFQIQNEISKNVTDRLELRITNNELPKIKTINSEAYRLFLEAKYVMNNTFSIEGDKKAEKLLKESIAIDSSYAPAWDLLSTVYHFLTDKGVVSFDNGYDKVKRTALKALELDSTYATVYSTLGTIAISYEKDYNKANYYVNKGLEIEPNNTEVLNRAAQVALLFNETEKAVTYNEKIAELDPIQEFSYYALGMTYYFAQMYPEAERVLNKALTITPDAEITHQLLTGALVMQNKLDEALEAAKKEPSEPLKYHSLAIAYYAMNEKEKTLDYLKLLKEKYNKDHSYLIASIYAFMGDADNAFIWLDKAKNYNDFGLTDLNVEPLFEPIHKDIRWNKYLKSLGLSPRKNNTIEKIKP